MSLQQLNNERATFIAAYTSHTITKTQLDTALANNQRQIDALNASQNPPKPTPAPPTVSPPNVSPLPAETPQQQFVDTSGTTWANTQPTQPKTPNLIPTAMGPIPKETFDAGAKDPTMQNVVIPGLEVAGIAALSLIPGAAPVVIGGAVAAPVIDVGVKSASKSLETGQAQLVLPGSIREVTDSAVLGAGLSVVGGAAVGGVAKVAPTLAGQAAKPIVAVATRTGINAGLGAGVSGVASGGNPVEMAKGAAFGASLGIVGELAGPVAGKVANTKTGQAVINSKAGQSVINAASNLKENVFGSKFTEITGAKAVEAQFTNGKTTTITELLEPTTKTVILRGQEAASARANNLSTVKNPVIDLAGTERVYTPDPVTGGKQLEPIPTLKQAEATRTATPILEAIKGNTKYKLASVKTGKSGDFLSTPSDVPALQRTKLEVITDKGQPNALLTERTVITSKDAILPGAKVSFKDYNKVIIRGKEDPLATFDYAKNVPSDLAETYYKELGGNYRPIVDYGSQAPKDLSGAMKQGSNDFFGAGSNQKGGKSAGDPVTGKASGAKANSVLESKSKTTRPNEQLPRAIVGEVKQTNIPTRFAVTSGSLAGIVNTRSKTTVDEETIYISYPKSGLPSPVELSTTFTQKTPSLNTQTNRYDTTVPNLVPKQTEPVIPPHPPVYVPDIITKPAPPSNRVIPVVTPVITIGYTPRNTPTTTPKQSTTIIPNVTITPAHKSKQTPYTPNYPSSKKTKLSEPILPFPRGGGDPFGGRGRGGGRFFERKNAIVTPKDLAGRFVGGGGRTVNQHIQRSRGRRGKR